MKVNRQELLQQLDQCRAGLATREIVEQSSCFIVKDGKLITFNDEICVRRDTNLNFEGAISAEPFLAILAKLVEEEIEIEPLNGELLIKGKGRRSGIKMEADILMPLDALEDAGPWVQLHADFCEAVETVGQCAAKNDSRFAFNCIHIHPEYLEACDNYQIVRYKLASGLESPTLARQSALKHVSSMDMTEMSETKSWLHFRNPAGVQLSIRRYVEDFPDMSGVLDAEAGAKTTLPGGLAEALDKAKIFSDGNPDGNQVLVELRPNKMSIKGQGAAGWFQEKKMVAYDGPEIAFMISPDLLTEITKKHNECGITANRLKVSNGKFVYVSCLAKPTDSAE